MDEKMGEVISDLKSYLEYLKRMGIEGLPRLRIQKYILPPIDEDHSGRSPERTG